MILGPVEEVVALCDHLSDHPDQPVGRLVVLGHVNRLALCEICAMALVGGVVQELFSGAMPGVIGVAEESAAPQTETQTRPRFQQERHEARNGG